MMVDIGAIPTVPEGATTTAVIAVIGAAGGIIATLAAAVGYLWRYYSRRQSVTEAKHTNERDAWAQERTAWSVERQRLEGFRDQLRAEYESKHNQAATHYAESIRALYDSTLEHENAARREYAANIESVSGTISESMDKIGVVIDKLYDRFIGPRRHRD